MYNYDFYECICSICNRLRRLESLIGQDLAQGMQATVIGGRKLLSSGEILPFDTIVTNQTSFLSLNTTTGEFTTTKAGNYLVLYYVNIDGTDANTEVAFSVNGIKSQAVSAVQGQMSGFALLTLSPGATISISNTSGQTVAISGTDIQAGITIISL